MEGAILHTTAGGGVLSTMARVSHAKNTIRQHTLRFETWKVPCCTTLQQMTFLELKAKICYLQPQGKVIINNVWKNLTGTWKEEQRKKK